MGDQYNIKMQPDISRYEPAPAVKKLGTEYTDYLRRTYRALDFKGIPQLESFSRELLLEEVYVPLMARPELPGGETWDRRLAGRTLGEETFPQEVLAKGESVPVRVEEALQKESRVVILGDPGSGKTTLLKYLTLQLAASTEAPLPILVPLNAYAEALPQEDTNLQVYLARYFSGMAQGVADLAPLFEDAISRGKAVILLDGLDEVQKDRAHLIHRVESFAGDVVRAGNRVVVTSRIVGYREAPLDPKIWTLYTLMDFNSRAIEDFSARWCLAFEKGTLGDTPEARASAEAERRALLEAVKANPGVERLASNPLLLTILALIKRQGVTLPNRRVELYELYLRTLLSAWSKARALDKRPVGPEIDYLQTIAVLGPLALWLRRENPTAGLVSEERLMEWLTDHFRGEEWGFTRDEAMKEGRAFLNSVQRYSNLLLERGKGRFGFIHLTFEEALAARGLVQLGQLGLDGPVKYICDNLTDPAWRETILLAIGIWGLIREEPLKAGEAVRAMLGRECGGEDGGKNVLMAGACLEDVGQQGLGRKAAGEVAGALMDAAGERNLPPVVQRDAGFILGRVGLIPDDLERFITIPAGPFLYGDEKNEVRIEHPFEISKYPVTNLQYGRFVGAGGYENQDLWSEDGWAWRTGTYDSKAGEDYEKRWLSRRPLEKRAEPFFWHDTRWNNPLAPVVGVTWFEAEAYCNWLAGLMGRPACIPTEEEWERACRYTDGREYPWGNDFDRNRLNCAEFWGGRDDLEWDKWLDEKGYEIASTTMVGQFREGDSEESVSDMCGNVWEWTVSWSDKEKKKRVLRGGSWSSYRRYARCAYRLRLIPDLFLNLVGFRVVSPCSGSGS